MSKPNFSANRIAESRRRAKAGCELSRLILAEYERWREEKDSRLCIFCAEEVPPSAVICWIAGQPFNDCAKQYHKLYQRFRRGQKKTEDKT